MARGRVRRDERRGHRDDPGLRANGVDVITIGQYLQPSSKHASIDRWVHPDEFRWFHEQGEVPGFGSVFSGLLVPIEQRAEANAMPQRADAALSPAEEETETGPSEGDPGSSFAACP